MDCPQAFKLAKKLQEECAEFARLSQDETYWNLSHRAIVIAWLKACVLYVANGCQWKSRLRILPVGVCSTIFGARCSSLVLILKRQIMKVNIESSLVLRIC